MPKFVRTLKSVYTAWIRKRHDCVCNTYDTCIQVHPFCELEYAESALLAAPNYRRLYLIFALSITAQRPVAKLRKMSPADGGETNGPRWSEYPSMPKHGTSHVDCSEENRTHLWDLLARYGAASRASSRSTRGSQCFFFFHSEDVQQIVRVSVSAVKKTKKMAMLACVCLAATAQRPRRTFVKPSVPT